MAAINVIIKPIDDEKVAKRIEEILSKPAKKPRLSKEAKELKKKISFIIK